MSKQNKYVISKLLDDLTHLEINTIIKKGMTSAPQPEDIEEVLYVLLSNYKEKTKVIIKRNELDFKMDEDEIHSFSQFYTALDAMDEYMEINSIRIEEGDYIIFIRMKSFCNYLRSRKDDIKFDPKSKAADGDTIYTINLKNFCDFKLLMDARDRVMIKRLYDLGTERIVMQTRFGIDGDVVTRIEENFANRPKQIVLDLHEEHTNLSLKYWQSLVSVAKSLLSDLISKKP
jgi:hypothetical protein